MALDVHFVSFRNVFLLSSISEHSPYCYQTNETGRLELSMILFYWRHANISKEISCNPIQFRAGDSSVNMVTVIL